MKSYKAPIVLFNVDNGICKITPKTYLSFQDNQIEDAIIVIDNGVLTIEGNEVVFDFMDEYDFVITDNIREQYVIKEKHIRKQNKFLWFGDTGKQMYTRCYLERKNREHKKICTSNFVISNIHLFEESTND